MFFAERIEERILRNVSKERMGPQSYLSYDSQSMSRRDERRQRKR
jgi:hypothetical protein